MRSTEVAQIFAGLRSLSTQLRRLATTVDELGTSMAFQTRFHQGTTAAGVVDVAGEKRSSSEQAPAIETPAATSNNNEATTGAAVVVSSAGEGSRPTSSPALGAENLSAIAFNRRITDAIVARGGEASYKAIEDDLGVARGGLVEAFVRLEERGVIAHVQRDVYRFPAPTPSPAEIGPVMTDGRKRNKLRAEGIETLKVFATFGVGTPVSLRELTAELGISGPATGQRLSVLLARGLISNPSRGFYALLQAGKDALDAREAA